MMDWRALREMAQYEPQDGPVVSLFLNLASPARVETELSSLIHYAHEEFKRDKNLDEKRRRVLGRLVTDVDKRVRKALATTTEGRLLVVFADAEGYWQEIRLPVALPSRLAIQNTPFIQPLSLLMDEFPLYAVLVADSRDARLFSLYLGDFREHPDVFMHDEVPDRVRTKKSMTRNTGDSYGLYGGVYGGVYGGMGDQKIQRHIKDHMHKHLKKVAESTFAFFKQEQFDRILLAAPDPAVLSTLKDHLHSYLTEKISGDFQARPEEDDQELKRKALDLARSIEGEQERKDLDRLVDLHFSGGLGVLGLEPVLSALRMGQIHTLVIKDDYKVSGYMCEKDRYLSAGPAPCPTCGEDLQPVEWLSEAVVQEALLQGAEIDHIRVDHGKFDDQGIGAFLRFRS